MLIFSLILYGSMKDCYPVKGLVFKTLKNEEKAQ